MKHIGNELDAILKSRKIVKRKFAEQLGMTDVNLSKVLKKPSVDAALLNKIAGLLCIPVSYFFNEEVEYSPTNIGHKISGQGNKISGNITLADCESQLSTVKTDLEKVQIEVNFLRKEVNDKNSLIAEKERYIDLLLQQLKRD